MSKIKCQGENIKEKMSRRKCQGENVKEKISKIKCQSKNVKEKMARLFKIILNDIKSVPFCPATDISNSNL